MTPTIETSETYCSNCRTVHTVTITSNQKELISIDIQCKVLP